MIIRVTMVACVAAGTVVGASQYSRNVSSSVQVPPLPTLSHMPGESVPPQCATWQPAVNETPEEPTRWRVQSARLPVFAGGMRSGTNHRPAAIPKRSTPSKFRSPARSASRSPFSGPSIFEQSSFSRFRRGPGPTSSGLGGHRRFGFRGGGTHGGVMRFGR